MQLLSPAVLLPLQLQKPRCHSCILQQTPALKSFPQSPCVSEIFSAGSVASAPLEATAKHSRHLQTAARASVSQKMADSTPAKLKLLCLHGYLQNAEIFRTRIGSMRKALKSSAEFVFMDAPHEAQGLPDMDADDAGGIPNGRAWWRFTDTGPSGRPSLAASYYGWDESFSAILAAVSEHRLDGILGFSQGATATALFLATLKARQQELTDLPQLKCAIMIAGFLPRDPLYATLLADNKPQIPVLFVTGTSDTLVPPSRTQELMDTFDCNLISTYTHGGAHLVPTCSAECKQTMQDFLRSVVQQDVRPMHRVQSTLQLATAGASQ